MVHLTEEGATAVVLLPLLTRARLAAQYRPSAEAMNALSVARKGILLRERLAEWLRSHMGVDVALAAIALSADRTVASVAVEGVVFWLRDDRRHGNGDSGNRGIYRVCRLCLEPVAVTADTIADVGVALDSQQHVHAPGCCASRYEATEARIMTIAAIDTHLCAETGAVPAPVPGPVVYEEADGASVYENGSMGVTDGADAERVDGSEDA